MSETSQTTSTQPVLAWTALTDAPLRGCQLAREARLLLAWDDAPTIYLFDLDGRRLRQARPPAPIQLARISDDGRRIALLLGGPRLLVLDTDLQPVLDRPTPSATIAIDVDAHGRYIALASRNAQNHLWTSGGRVAAKWTSRQPLAHVRFIPTLPRLLGAAGYGMIQAFDFVTSGDAPRFDVETAWDERLLSNLGRLETTGDGAVILASCYNVGVLKYDANGHNEGSYHLGGTALHAVPDFPGRLFATATQEGDVSVLNRAGNVRWKSNLGKAPIALEFDPLGRFLIHGAENGTLSCVDFEGEIAERLRSGRVTSVKPARGGRVRTPDWSRVVARDDEQGQAAVLAVLPEPVTIGLALKDNRLTVLDEHGETIDTGTEIAGLGRFVRTAPGWIVLATDRQITLYDARRRVWHRPDLDLVQVTHLLASPDKYGVAIVQERDRIGRATLAGRWVWRKELRQGIEEIAVGALGLTAYTDDTGTLEVIDAAGESAGVYHADPAEPLLLVEGAEPGSGSGPAWVTLARRAQILRGHAPDGSVLWETPTPWEGWHLLRLGARLAVTAPDGRALIYDTKGFLQHQTSADGSISVLHTREDGSIGKVVAKGVHLISSDLSGSIGWRSVGEVPFRPIAACAAGVAAVHGRELHWYGTESGSR